uniref:Uncharacterized protein n=1 Tax=Tanacetum cinerariifolium TaxID=118510 RepID=A0A6L2P3Y4_TANCI|nr:hypothetical protein [Tanacetum cinerariifolium]
MSNTNATMPTQTSKVLHNDTVSSCSTSKVQEKTQLSRSRCMHSFREVKSQFKFLTETLQGFEFKECMQKYTTFNAQSFRDAMIKNMDFIMQYMLETILYQQEIQQLLNEKKLQTQEVQSNTVQELKVDPIVMENTCSGKENSNSETASINSVKESSFDSETKDVHAIKYTIGTKSEVQDKSSRPGNETDTDDAYIRPIYDEEPMAEVQFTLECNIFSTRQQHTEQPEIINEAQIEEKVFAIAALKNELRKSKANSMDTKFSKTSVLGKSFLQSLRNQSVVRQSNAFKSERPQISKPRVASQIDVRNDLSKPVTQHYLPKRKESAFAKPNHMIASSSSRNRSKNMPCFSSNDMVHNHYLKEATTNTQEKDMNSKSSVMHVTSTQSTTKGSTPKPRSNNQTSRSLHASKSSCVTISAVPKADHSKNSSPFLDSKHFVCSTCQKGVFNANHDACITTLLKEVISHAKIQSYKTTNNNKPVDQKRHTQKPSRQIIT